MSTAHRPTWAPAQARQTGSGSKQVSVKDVAGNTKLKFRQPGQGTTSEISRRDLKLELAKAEETARNKRKGITVNDDEVPKAGLIAGAPMGTTQQAEDEQAAKRRKLIEQAAELDRDDSDAEEEDEVELGTAGDAAKANGNGKGKEKAVEAPNNDDDDDDEEEDSEDEEEDDEDETAELLRELEKIKKERAMERSRQDSERAASAAISAEEAAAMGNPLLNLQAALSGNKTFDSTPGGYSSSASSASFQIKKRWDDDVIFKNQATGNESQQKEFINDSIRSNFHRRFMAKYIA